MAKKNANSLSVTRLTRTIYFFIGFYALSIVIFDAGNLLTRDAIIDRWTLASALLLVNTIVWLMAIQGKNKASKKNTLTALMTVALLLFAGFTTYWERGMASTSTLFYVFPLLVVATMKNRHALLATATSAAGIYSFAAVKYFNDFFNEGFRIQLWGHIALYCGAIFTASWLIMITAGLRHDSK